MTDINDKRSFVYQLQCRLYELARHGANIKTVFPDGIFGKETAHAVCDFQKEHGLAENGKVDLITWNAITEECRRVKERDSDPVSICPFASQLKNGCVGKGDRGDLVVIIQIILNALQPSYPGFGPLERDGIYENMLADAVSYFQSKNGLEPSGTVDKLTWNRMAEQYDRACRYPL